MDDKFWLEMAAQISQTLTYQNESIDSAFKSNKNLLTAVESLAQTIDRLGKKVLTLENQLAGRHSYLLLIHACKLEDGGATAASFFYLPETMSGQNPIVEKISYPPKGAASDKYQQAWLLKLWSKLRDLRVMNIPKGSEIRILLPPRSVDLPELVNSEDEKVSGLASEVNALVSQLSQTHKVKFVEKEAIDPTLIEKLISYTEGK